MKGNINIIKDTKKKISAVDKKEIKAFDDTQKNMNRAHKRNEKLDIKTKIKTKFHKNENHQLAQMPRYRPITRQMLAKFNAEN